MHSPDQEEPATRIAAVPPATPPSAASTDGDHKQLATGTLLKNRFELLEEIGRGGMGTVYKALDKRDIEAEQTKFLAVKVLNDELQADNALLKALHSEAKKSQELAHPNIVTVYDFDREDDRIFLTMEYMDGVSLDQVIRGNPNGLPLAQALHIIDQLGAALAYAHSRHIIHSDFKPSNVFVGRDKRVKVIDFGIARVVKSERREKFDAGVLRGLTPAYASLEMFQDLEADPKDDIYALACVAYELLTGHHPYDRQRADAAKRQALEPKKPRILNRRQWSVLRAGLQLDRNKRIGDVAAFYQGLHAKQTLPLSAALALSAAMTAALTLLLFKAPLTSYWERHFGRPPAAPTQGDQRSAGGEPATAAAVYSAAQYPCLQHKRALLTLQLETQGAGADAPRPDAASPGLNAVVFRALKPYGLEWAAGQPSSTEDIGDLHRRFDAQYLLKVMLSVREIPITAVKTSMKTIQGRISLQLVDIGNGRIVNTASAEFKQPGLDMRAAAEDSLQQNIDRLSAELLAGVCP